MQPVLEEMRGAHLDSAELESFALLKKDTASQDMVEVMTVNSLWRKNSFLESAPAIADGKFPLCCTMKQPGTIRVKRRNLNLVVIRGTAPVVISLITI